MTKLEELKARHTELKGQIKTESEAWFKEQSAALFAKYPTMLNFSWTQYTPYFNDGDACTFSVHNYPEINGEDSYGETTAELRPAFKEVEALIGGIDEPTMEAMFGDHVKIVCQRDGVQVNEYSHD
jgi:hypothetical protein